MRKKLFDMHITKYIKKIKKKVEILIIKKYKKNKIYKVKRK